jgi:hypothetical protein
MQQRVPANTIGYEVFTIGGYFTTKADGTVDTLVSTGGAFASASRTAEGVYKVVLADRWKQLYAVAPSFKPGTPVTAEVHVSAHDVDHATAPYVTITSIDHADTVDAAADIDSGEIYLTLVVGRRAAT